MTTLNFSVNARKIAIILAMVALCLACLSVVGRFILEQTPEADESSLIFNVVQLVNVNRETNIPSWFSSGLLLACAAALAVIAAAKRADHAPYARHWTALAVIFLYLSIDEAAGIHETLTQPLQVSTGSSHYLYFAWVIVAIPLVLIFALAYLPFLLHLPPRLRNLFILAGVLYVGGALVIEMVGSNLWYDVDGSSVMYSLVGTVEELFEMWGAIVLLYALLNYIQGAQVTVDTQAMARRDVKNAPDVPDVPLTRRRSAVVVFLGGVNLILVQWMLVRELSALLFGTELIVLLVSIAYFAGISLGYAFSRSMRRSWLVPLAVMTLVMHLALPVWLRLVVVVLDANGVYGLSFIVLPLLTVLVVPAFYSMFLPYLAQATDPESAGLPFLYMVELIGAVCGVLVLVLISSSGVQSVLVIYTLALLGVIYLAARRFALPVVLAAGIFSALWIAAFPAVNEWSNTLWYQQVRGLPEGTRTLLTTYSPYQKVDVLEAPNGSRYMFLDSLEHFGSEDTQWLSVIMGRIPAQLMQPQTGLSIGAGGMVTARMMAEYGNTAVKTVELDPVVVDASLRFLTKYNAMDTLRDRTIVVDDAKHFLANTSDMYDLITTDTPAAINLQTATLYSVPFYQLIKARTNPGGVLAANLTDTFEPDDPTTPEQEGLVARRITASLLAVYDDVMVVTSGSAGWSFAYAADKLPFTREDVEMALSGAGERVYVLYDPAAVKAIAGDAPPITLDTMDIVLETSVDWIKDRLK